MAPITDIKVFTLFTRIGHEHSHQSQFNRLLAKGSLSDPQERLVAEMTLSLHVCAHMQSKTTPSRSKWVPIDFPALHLTMNILLVDKWGFALEVMVDVIHCHHTGLVNTTNITVQPGCLYVPDLQLPPPTTPPSRRLKQQVTNTV